MHILITVSGFKLGSDCGQYIIAVDLTRLENECFVRRGLWWFCCTQYVIDCRLDEVWRDYIFDLVAMMPLTLPVTHTQLRDCYRRLLTLFRESAAKLVTICHLQKSEAS